MIYHISYDIIPFVNDTAILDYRVHTSGHKEQCHYSQDIKGNHVPNIYLWDHTDVS